MKSRRLGQVPAIILIVSLSGAAAQAAIRYVALDGAGTDGQSWATAYKTLGAAIGAADTMAGDEIWIKQGTYASGSTVALDKAIVIRGGYSGAGDTRDPLTYKTIVDGTRMAIHCFDVSADASFDGLTITRGGANGSGQSGQGGGMYIHGCKPTISLCTFRLNHAAYRGGAIALSDATGTVIADCTFTENSSTEAGGAIACYRSDAEITRCQFQTNATGDEDKDGFGGAIRNDTCSPKITDCAFTANAATYGGGISNYQSAARIEDCTFADCGAVTIGGGGVHNFGGTPFITRCLFTGNEVIQKGGAIWDVSLGTVTDCVLWDNSAGTYGGGIFVESSTSGTLSGAQIINCTVYGNNASDGGGLTSNGASPTLTNCILWANTCWGENPEIHNMGWIDETAIANYCDIAGDDVYPGRGNLNLDPQFVDPRNGNFSLYAGSPCVESGTNDVAGIQSKDFTGSRRISDGDEDGTSVVDMGACELQGFWLADHVYRGEILQGILYENPDDTTPEYMFLMEIETDAAVGSIEFQTPAGNTYVIPSDAHTVSGNVETYHVESDDVHIWQYWARLRGPDELKSYGDGTYTITYHLDLSDMTTWTSVPRTRDSVAQIDYTLADGGAIPQPTEKPNVTSPAYGASIASPVTLTWDACTDRNVNAVLVNVFDTDGENGLVGDSLAASATVSSEYTLPEGLHDAELSFAGLYEATDSATVPFDVGKVVTIGHQFEVLYATVFRFWSPVNTTHFYTISPAERDNLLINYPDIFAYEGQAYHTCSTAVNADLAAVFRFWSPVIKSHFYTINELERDWLVENYPSVWTYEGIAFYAYPEDQQPGDAVPVFRFWWPERGCHFYTVSEEEKDALIRDWSQVWLYEGIAFYAYE